MSAARYSNCPGTRYRAGSPARGRNRDEMGLLSRPSATAVAGPAYRCAHPSYWAGDSVRGETIAPSMTLSIVTTITYSSLMATPWIHFAAHDRALSSLRSRSLHRRRKAFAAPRSASLCGAAISVAGAVLALVILRCDATHVGAPPIRRQPIPPPLFFRVRRRCTLARGEQRNEHSARFDCSLWHCRRLRSPAG